MSLLVLILPRAVIGVNVHELNMRRRSRLGGVSLSAFLFQAFLEKMVLWVLECTLGRRQCGFVREILRRGREEGGMLAFSAFSFVLGKVGLGLA